MKHGSLFSGGCDGFSLAAKWAGWQTVFQVEQNEFRQHILAKNFPEAKRYGDIRRFDAKPYRGTIDIISGGFPCQPFSVAGKQRGKTDNRYLWPEMLRIIKEVSPSWVVGENVAVIRKMVLNEVLSDLEAIGYITGAYIIPACAINAPHRRDRVWIVAYSERIGWGRRNGRKNKNGGTNEKEIANSFERPNQISRHASPHTNKLNDNISGLCTSKISQQQTPKISRNIITDTNSKGLQGWHKQKAGRGQKSRQFRPGDWDAQWFEVATKLCTLDDGLPKGLAKAERSAIYRAVKYFGRKKAEKILGISLKKVNPWRNEQIAATGDAIVPQVAYEIFKAINEYTQMKL